jgi:hypothetical protein
VKKDVIFEGVNDLRVRDQSISSALFLFSQVVFLLSVLHLLVHLVLEIFLAIVLKGISRNFWSHFIVRLLLVEFLSLMIIEFRGGSLGVMAARRSASSFPGIPEWLLTLIHLIWRFLMEIISKIESTRIVFGRVFFIPFWFLKYEDLLVKFNLFIAPWLSVRIVIVLLGQTVQIAVSIDMSSALVEEGVF